MDLNEAQSRAARAPGNAALKVEAGAGTGKTSTLVGRYCKLLLEDRIPPERILALTFTRKAASEMRERIFKAVARLKQPWLARSLYSAEITNFHSFCHRIIWQDPTRFGIHPEFSVATDVEIARIRRSIYRDVTARRIDSISGDTIDPDMTPGKLQSFVSTCFGIIEKCRGLTLRPEDLQNTLRSDDEPEYRHHIEIIIALWKEYEQRLQQHALLDFTGLIDVVVRTIESDSKLRAELAGRFDYILVDEFQDTSDVQNRLLRLLSGGMFHAVTVVGDEKQSIYRWRDARADNLREFEAASEQLLVNYRSRQEILDLASAFISLDPAYAEQVQNLIADRGSDAGAITIFHPAEKIGQGPLLEARALCAWIGCLAAGGHGAGPLPYDNMAILMRSLKPAAGLAAIESELRRHDIPYIVVGATASLEGGVLLSLKHLLILMIYSAEPASAESLLYLLEEKPFSLNDEELLLLFRAAHDILKGEDVPQEEIDRRFTAELLLSGTALAAIGDADKRGRVEALTALLAELRHAVAVLDFQSFMGLVLEKGCLYLRLFDAGAGTAVIENALETVYGIVEEMMRKCETTVSTCIEYLESLTGDEVRSGGGEPYLPPGRVPIMTIHQAKGLEFAAVAVPGLKKKQSSGMSFYVSEWEGVFLSKRTGRDIKECDAALRYKDEIKQEERCLVYVAMTRARDFLFLSSPEPGEERDSRKSNFFPEIIECLDAGGIPHDEWRDPPDVSAVIRPGVEPPEEPAAAGRDLFNAWRSGAERLQKDREIDPVPRTPVIATTWKALASFAACPLHYYFTYVRKLPADSDMDELPIEPGHERDARGRLPSSPVPGIDGPTYGTFVHHLLELVLRNDGTAPEMLATIIRAEAEAFDFPPAAVDALCELLPPLVNAVLADRVRSQAVVTHREQPFYLRIGGLLCTGIIDRIDRTGDRYWIIDYKTGKAREEYHLQVRYYAWAWSKIAGTAEVQGALAYIRPDGGREPVDTGREALDEIERVAARLDSALAADRFDATPGDVCTACEHAGMCPHAAQ